MHKLGVDRLKARLACIIAASRAGDDASIEAELRAEIVRTRFDCARLIEQRWNVERGPMTAAEVGTMLKELADEIRRQ